MFSTRVSGLVFAFGALLPASTLVAEVAVAVEPAAPALPPVFTLGEALEATLAKNPGVQITREQVRQREGSLQSASGQFDLSFGTFWSEEIYRAPTGAPAPFASVLREDTSIYSVGLIKPFRSGVIVSPQINVLDSGNDTPGNVPVSRSSLDLKITVPLLRGFGTQNTGAQEIAAGLAADAQRNLARYQVELIVFQTAAAYWNCLAARRDFEILSDTAGRAEQILQAVELLASGGELDRATRDQARALVASKQAERENGELLYYEARQALGVSVGLGPSQLVNPPLVAGEPPVMLDAQALRPAIGEKYVYEALQRRGDYQASNINVEAEEALLRQAKNNLKPLLDFELTVGYAGYDARRDRFRPGYSVSNDLTGINTLGTLTLEWPIANNVARGQVVNQRARRNEAQLNTERNANSIASRVLVALQTLRQTISQYRYNAVAVDTYRVALNQTNEKMKAGEATITELIDVEERYADARRALNETERVYAITLAELRLVTGTLSEVVDSRAVFDVRTLSEIPFTP